MDRSPIASKALMRNVPRRLLNPAASLWAAAAMAAMLGGCAKGTMTDIVTVQEFDQKVVNAGRPVLVDFYKDNCPTCVIQEADLEPLLDEYRGRVDFYRYKIREATMASSSPEIMDRYGLFWVPTVILFVNGQEVERWVFNHPTSEFRRALDKVLSQGTQPVPTGAVDRSTWPPPASLSVLTAMGTEDQCLEGMGCPVQRPTQ